MQLYQHNQIQYRNRRSDVLEELVGWHAAAGGCGVQGRPGDVVHLLAEDAGAGRVQQATQQGAVLGVKPATRCNVKGRDVSDRQWFHRGRGGGSSRVTDRGKVCTRGDSR